MTAARLSRAGADFIAFGTLIVLGYQSRQDNQSAGQFGCVRLHHIVSPPSPEGTGMIHQRTLSQTISASGVGLHSGERVKLTLPRAARYWHHLSSHRPHPAG